MTKLQLLHNRIGDREGMSEASVSRFVKYQWPGPVVKLVDLEVVVEGVASVTTF